MIEICVPVLNRYDLLERLLDSLPAATKTRYKVLVIDNGKKSWRPKRLNDVNVHTVFTPTEPMGVAASWNWFIRNTKTERFIVNDDIVFSPGSIDRMFTQQSCFVSCGFGFSCFLLRDECVERVGYFDEAISPGYAYFEDRDYYNRMQASEIKDIVVECGIVHGHSQTLAMMSQDQIAEHHRKFDIAQRNFLAKWGDGPWSPSLSRQ